MRTSYEETESIVASIEAGDAEKAEAKSNGHGDTIPDGNKRKSLASSLIKGKSL